MKKQIVLNLSNLQGKARSVVSEFVQKQLFQAGYHWRDQHPTLPANNVPQNTNAAYMRVNVGETNDAKFHIGTSAMPELVIESPAFVFEATRDLDMFLEMATRLGRNNFDVDATIGSAMQDVLSTLITGKIPKQDVPPNPSRN